MRTCMPHFLN